MVPQIAAGFGVLTSAALFSGGFGVFPLSFSSKIVAEGSVSRGSGMVSPSAVG